MQTRIYAIDKLRAIMMLLGIVIHTGIVYDLKFIGPLKDPYATTPMFDILIEFIHTFRMPIFFVISGFLTAMLFFERGPKQMLLNRLHRIVLPLLVGLVIFYPAVIVFNGYFMEIKAGTITPFATAIQKLFIAYKWLDIKPVHLWFLYYLMWFCFAGWGITLLTTRLSTVFNEKIKEYFKAVVLFKWAPIVFALPTCLLFYKMKVLFINTPFNFRIDNNTFLTYGYFFTFGWILYKQKAHLNRFIKDDILFTSLGIIFFAAECGLLILKPGIEKTHMIYVLASFNGLAVWLLTFGFIGLFLSYFNNYSATGRYISDASYWVYLVHYPVVIFIQSLLINFNLNAFIKFIIVMVCTLAITFVSYNYLVRNTLIGKFLNGRKYPRGLPSQAHKPENNIAIS